MPEMDAIENSDSEHRLLLRGQLGQFLYYLHPSPRSYFMNLGSHCQGKGFALTLNQLHDILVKRKGGKGDEYHRLCEAGT
jgi:hypothetical protein